MIPGAIQLASRNSKVKLSTKTSAEHPESICKLRSGVTRVKRDPLKDGMGVTFFLRVASAAY